MAAQTVFNLQGLQLGVQPLLQSPGQFTRLVNVDSNPVGAKQKRPGYITFLGTPDNNSVVTLFDWHRDSGTSFNLYRQSGSLLYYSSQGTGAWTVCGNGTYTAGSPIGYGVLNDTLIIGDGVGSTRHSTDGVSFTDTVGAPIASRFVDYQNRIYAIGTANFLFYSTTGDPTNWSTSGTSDSSSLTIPGPGKLLDVMKVADQVVTTKNTGLQHRWDGFQLIDTATALGFTSPQSIVNIEDYRIGLNRLGYFGFSGSKPKLISNDIEPQIYGNSGSAIVGTVFDNAPGGVYKYQYMCSVGTTMDDFTAEPISNCLQVYDFLIDQWSNYSFGTRPTAFVKYKDSSGNDQAVFGDSTGQCYTFGGTALSDNGLPITAVMEYIYTDGAPHLDKDWRYYQFIFNPGCQARVQVAFSDTYTNSQKVWVDLGQAVNGVLEGDLPAGSRSKILFVKVSDSSSTARFIWYGMNVVYDPLPRS